jgi:hypothetical protein
LVAIGTVVALKETHLVFLSIWKPVERTRDLDLFISTDSIVLFLSSCPKLALKDLIRLIPSIGHKNWLQFKASSMSKLPPTLLTFHSSLKL